MKKCTPQNMMSNRIVYKMECSLSFMFKLTDQDSKPTLEKEEKPTENIFYFIMKLSYT